MRIISRLQKLEKHIRIHYREFPPFTRPEMEALVERIRRGGGVQSDELEQLRQYLPILERNLVIHAGERGIYVKRYIGIDFEEV
jgi:hypothetical protein